MSQVSIPTDAAPLAATPPRPFSDFPQHAIERKRTLRAFKAIGLILRDQQVRSLTHARAKLASLMAMGKCSLRGACPSFSTLRGPVIQARLRGLLKLSFGREVVLYRTRWPDGGDVIGLTEDGKEALRLAIEYLAGIDQDAPVTE